jgi:hypothetical protein
VGEVALISIEKQNPLTLTLSPLGRGEGNLRQVHHPKNEAFSCDF